MTGYRPERPRTYSIFRTMGPRTVLKTPKKDPTLFSGTVKFNLDPENQRTEEECENAIRICKLEKTIDQCGGLFGEIKRGGSNFSGNLSPKNVNKNYQRNGI